jgi:hypothetical protein
MLYELMTGRQPFEGETALQILVKASQSPALAPSRIMKVEASPAAARALEAICLKAMAKSPGDRYPSAEEMARDLERWEAGETVRASPPSTARRTRIVPPRRRSPAIGIGAAAALAVALSAFLLRPSGPSPEDVAARRELERRLREEAAAREAEQGRLREAQQKLEAVSRAVSGNGGGAPPLPATRPPRPLAPGAIGEYSPTTGPGEDRLALRRLDPGIDFDWSSAPPWPGGPRSYFYVHWRGYFEVPETGTYLFQTRSDDGVKLFVDDGQVIMNWTDHPAVIDTGTRTLEKGYHRLTLEYYQGGGEGCITLSWRKAEAISLSPLPLLHDPAEFKPFGPPAVTAPPAVQEADALRVARNTGGPTRKNPFGASWSGAYSGQEHLWWSAGPPGTHLHLEFASPVAGRRPLIVALTRAKDHGIFRIAVNGRTVAEGVDLYSPRLETGEREFRDVELRSGANVLEITVTGSHPSAKEWSPGAGVHKIGIDYLRVVDRP